ncbi:Major facilitator superfamily, partial [Globisporangium splendens]
MSFPEAFAFLLDEIDHDDLARALQSDGGAPLAPVATATVQHMDAGVAAGPDALWSPQSEWYGGAAMPSRGELVYVEFPSPTEAAVQDRECNGDGVEIDQALSSVLLATAPSSFASDGSNDAFNSDRKTTAPLNLDTNASREQSSAPVPRKPPMENSTRKRQKEELAYLRDKVQQLELELASLKERVKPTGLPKESSGSLEGESKDQNAQQPLSNGRDDAIETNATATEKKIVPTTSLWERVAKRQLIEKQKAEMKNLKLKEALEDQLKIAKSLEKVLKKRPSATVTCLNHQYVVLLSMINANSGFLLNSKRFCTLSRSEASIYDLLIANTERVYAEIDDVCARNEYMQLEEDINDTKLMVDASNQLFMEITHAKIIPFDLQTTLDGVWRCLSLAHVPIADGSYEAVERTVDTICAKSIMALTVRNNQQAMVHTRFVIRKFVEKDRVVLVCESSTHSEGPREIVHSLKCLEKGWVVIRPVHKSKTNDDGDAVPSTIIQLCMRLTPTISGDMLESQRRHTGAITDLILGSFNKSLSLLYQAVENIIMENVLPSSTPTQETLSSASCKTSHVAAHGWTSKKKKKTPPPFVRRRDSDRRSDSNTRKAVAASAFAFAPTMEDDGDYGTFLESPGKFNSNSAVNINNTERPYDGGRKWLMVAILSVLSGVNQAICYSYAPIASIAESRWQQHLHSTELITVYFVSYIPCSFLGSWLMDKKGLRYGVLLGALLQALGAILRYAATFSDDVATEARVTLLGQIVASVAMPFMVNSPPVLSANWFPPSLRATSTSIAVNANAMGTALVYLTAPFIVHSEKDLVDWNLYVAFVACASAAFASATFRSFPRSASSKDDIESVVSDVHLQDEYDWKQWGHAFLHQGFWHTVLSFSIAECVLNAMSALLGKFLSTDGFTKSQIGCIGAAFIVSSLLGGQLISRYVDQKRNHKQAMQFCLVLTAASLAAFKLTLNSSDVLFTFASLLFVGAFLGPLQPIVLELGVECAFPTSEATVAALQQLCGNFLSAILVPGLSVLRRTHTDETGHVPAEYFYASPEWIMVFLLGLTFVDFCFYNGEYKRYDHETGVIRPEVLQSKATTSLDKMPSFLPVTVKKPLLNAKSSNPSKSA